MKNLISLIIFFVISLNMTAQSDHDWIGHKDFYILRTGSDMSNTTKLKASEIKSVASAEKLYGIKYKTKKYTDKMSDEKFTQILYDDGLMLDIPENQRKDNFFRITSDKYIMFLASGKVIKVGMSASELKSIFPKSYSMREVITHWAEMQGKTSFIVYFSFIKDNVTYPEDAWIIFILSNENGVLEQFRSFEPE